MLTSVKNLNKAITKVMDDVQIATADKVYIFVKEFVRISWNPLAMSV